jgi:hypothetical protein
MVARNPDTQIGTHRHSFIPGAIDPLALGIIGSVTKVTVDHFKTANGQYLGGTHVVGTGAYRLLVVAISHTIAVNYCNCDGVAMTKYGSTYDAVNEAHVSIYYKLAPNSGDNVISAQSSGSDYWSMGVIDFINVNQFEPFYGQAGNSDTDGYSTTTVSGAVGDYMLSWLAYWWNAGTASQDQTELWQENVDGGWKGAGAGAAGASSITINWSTWSSNSSVCAVIMIKKA